MSLMNSLTDSEKDFLQYKDEHSRGRIIKYLENGLSFDKAVIKEAGESLISYYDWIRNNIRDIDKHKLNEFDNKFVTFLICFPHFFFGNGLILFTATFDNQRYNCQ